MAQNREHILENFLACTGMEDMSEAILHLEEANWDLLAAVRRVVPQETQALPAETFGSYGMHDQILPRSSAGGSSDHVPGENSYAPSSHNPPDIAQLPNSSFNFVSPALPATAATASDPCVSHYSPSTSQAHADKLTFKIKYLDGTFMIDLPADRTVEDLKYHIKHHISVEPSQQLLTGWASHPPSDSCTFSSLNLPPVNSLLLTAIPVPESDNKPTDRLCMTYSLNVNHEGNKQYCLKFPGSRTILEVKTDVYTLTDIPVRHQSWTGWPETVQSDKTMLSNANLNYPVHELTVRKSLLSSPPKSPAQPKKKASVLPIESDASEEEFEDATESLTGDEDQEIFMEYVPTKKLRPLIPADTEDEMAGAVHFADEFVNRYGPSHPHFFPGTLDDALKESCLKPAKSRRLLALYLHHDGSVLSNVFCTQLLCFESVLTYLTTYFVMWGWDITYESNKLLLLNSISQNLGSVAAMTVRSLQLDRLPALIILTRNRGSTEILTIVHGNVGASELLTSLIQAVDVFSEQQTADLKTEEERAAREMIRMEQDRAYQASLAVDRAKEESKKQQELIQEQERERLQKEKEELERIQKQEESLKEARRLEIERQLPPEPEEGSGDNTTKIRYKLPSGDFIERRFLACTPLQALLDFLTVKGFPTDNYKVIASWPRRDLTTLDAQQSLADLKLYPQETVMIEER